MQAVLVEEFQIAAMSAAMQMMMLLSHAYDDVAEAWNVDVRELDAYYSAWNPSQ